MTRLPGWREQFREAKRANEDFFYPLLGIFVHGPHEWEVHFNVTDVQRLKPDELQRMRFYADANGLLYTDLQQVKVHPDDTEPYPGAVLREYTDDEGNLHQDWNGGTLEILDWSSPGKISGSRTGTAVLRRP